MQRQSMPPFLRRITSDNECTYNCLSETGLAFPSKTLIYFQFLVSYVQGSATAPQVKPKCLRHCVPLKSGTITHDNTCDTTNIVGRLLHCFHFRMTPLFACRRFCGVGLSSILLFWDDPGAPSAGPYLSSILFYSILFYSIIFYSILLSSISPLLCRPHPSQSPGSTWTAFRPAGEASRLSSPLPSLPGASRA